MGKLTFLGFLLVVATVLAMTTSLVYPPPVGQSVSVVEKISPSISKDKDSSSSEGNNDDDHDKSEDSSESVDDKEQMLCNVIVRATYDLHVHQRKSSDEITIYLDMDCNNLANKQLIGQCREMVAQHGVKIYKHITTGVEMSKICKMIEDHNEVDLDDQETDECSQKDGNKCQCCIMHVKKRKMRLRYIVKQIAKKRMYMCQKCPRPHRCRQWVRREEWHQLKRIEKICPYMICKHLGYCTTLIKENDKSELMVKSKIDTVVALSSLSIGLIDQQLETHLTNNVCGEFKELQPLCIHLAGSVESRRYVKIYMSVIHNDTKWIENDLDNEVQLTKSALNVDLRDACKNVIQSSTNFYLQALEPVRNSLDSTCQKCPAKDKCEEFFNKQSETINNYLHSLKPDGFCSVVHPYSSSLSTALSPINSGEVCTICLQRLQPRKDAATEAINRLSLYFTDRCAKLDIPQCQQFVSEVMTEVHSFINEFDVQGTCMAMGFCQQNLAYSMDDYEHAFVEEINKNVCSILGPFETLCHQLVQGDSKQVQTVNLNLIFNATNINDFFLHCEEKGDEENGVDGTTDQCSENKDKCQCCINRVIQKKKCLKKRVAKYVWHMVHLCKRCPAQEKCQNYWKEKKACWDAKIDKICPKKVCIRMGYCKKAETSSMCAYMGPLKQGCEQAFDIFGQFFGEEQQQPSTMLAVHVSLQLQDEKENESLKNKP